MTNNTEKSLVYLDNYGLLGSNYYWNNHERMGISKEEILEVGLENDRVCVHEDIIDELKSIDEIFQEELGYRLYIREGYRSEELYKLIYRNRSEKFGEEQTDKLLNTKDMPHATGKSVDVSLLDEKTDELVSLRDKNDGVEAMFVDFYKDKNSPEAKRYQKLQKFVINTMQDHGFRLGTRQEYFHFDYRPDTERNYPIND